MVEPSNRFSQKAQKYARYRWDYSPQAIEMIFILSKLSCGSSVADIGSGTGMLSSHLVGKVKSLYAIEPNSEMRDYSKNLLPISSNINILDGLAEALPLPDQSIDMIMVGRAIHWFDASKARAEFLRVLKPNGWLAILQVPCLNRELVEAVKSIRTAENNWNVENDKSRLNSVSPNFYYGNQEFIDRQFPQTITETWDEFFGRLCSLSPAPNEDDESLKKFKNAAHGIFRKFSKDDRLTIEIATQIQLGRISSL